jgi:hypothetical protein
MMKIKPAPPCGQRVQIYSFPFIKKENRSTLGGTALFVKRQS